MGFNYKPVVLVICDGWGVAPESEGNAVTKANTPNFDNYLKNYPAMTLASSGSGVGLLFGQMGNSEVGHLNIGAGRVYYQSCPRLNNEIETGNFFENSAFLDTIENAKKNKTALHLIGLLSNGNVHSSNEHLYTLLQLCKQQKFTKQVYIHVVLDGRDALKDSGKEFVQELETKIKEFKVGEIASISGRYYAMDRDNRWDRIKKAYNTIAKGESVEKFDDAIKAIDSSYNKEIFDEEFEPVVITKKNKPVATVNENDSIIFFNFRPDRARELTKAFVLPGFSKFERKYISGLNFVTMMEYEKDLPVVVAYFPQTIKNSLAEVISLSGMKQLHIAETEKYAHITFFLNGTVEDPFEGEDRKIIPSPHVSSYAEVPEMSSKELSKEVVRALNSDKYDFVAVNFANADMVGHTANEDASIKAVEAVDEGLGKIVENTLAKNGIVLMTADHGNAEEVLNLETNKTSKEHSNNPVPFVVIGNDFMGQAGPSGDPPEGDLSLMRPVGILADVAPTVLSLLGLPQPPEMTGRPLI